MQCTKLFLLFSAMFYSVAAWAALPEYAGVSLGRWVGAFVWCIGFVKCVQIMLRPKTSTICVLSLALVVIMNPVFFLLTVLELDNAYFVVALGLVMAVSAFVLAIAGLSTYDKEKFNQGKSQAIWAIVLIVAIGMFAYATYHKDPVFPEESAENATISEEYNFEIVPPPGYVSYDASIVSEDASVALINRKKGVNVLVIAETFSGNAITLDDLVTSAKINASAGGIGSDFSEPMDYAVGDLQGKRMSLQAMVDGDQLFFEYWLYVNNGFAYQVVVFKSGNDQLLAAEATNVFKAFSVLESGRVAQISIENALEDYHSEAGYAIEGAGALGWQTYDAENEDLYAPDVTSVTSDFSYFATTSICGLQVPATSEGLTYALFDALDVDYPDQVTESLGDVVVGSVSAKGYKAIYPSDDMEFPHLVYVVPNGPCLVGVALWTTGSFENLEDKAESLLPLFSFSGADETYTSSAEKQAWYINSIGVYLFDVENYLDAERSFAQAANLDDTNPVHFTNRLHVLNQLQRYDEGLQVGLEAWTYFPENTKVLSWLGWFAFQLDHFQLAVEHYESAFAAGYQGTDDLQAYVSALVALDQSKQALEVLEAYAQEPVSDVLQMRKLELLVDLDRNDEALERLEQLQSEGPFTADAAFQAHDIFYELGHYPEAENIAQDLIDRGFGSARAYYALGDAQYQQDNFIAAKHAFSKALEYEPGNADVEEYLRFTLAQLGEGDSSLISQALEPVPLPEQISLDDSEISDDNIHAAQAHYLLDAVAMHFEPGSPFRKTYYRRVHIDDEGALEAFSTMTVRFNELSEQVYVNTLNVQDAEGATTQANRSAFYVSDDAEYEQSTYRKIVRAPVTGLSVGDTIEFVYTVASRSNKNTLPFERIAMRRRKPVSYSVISVNGAVDELTFTSRHLPEPQTGDDHMIWTQSDLPAIESESMLPDSSEYRPYLAIGHAENWSELGKDYLTDIQDRITSDTQSVSGVLLDIFDENASELEKVAQLAEYVRETLTYKPIEFGVRGIIPNPVSTILNDQYGDCKDHSLLLMRLLRAAGIEAELALASFSNPVFPDIASLDQFNHMVVYLPALGEDGLFIDATDKGANLLDVAPDGLGDTWALVLDDQPELKRIPAHTASRISINRSMEPAGRQRFSVTEEIRFGHYFGSSWRVYLAGIEEKQRFSALQSFLAKKNQDLDLKTLTVQNLDDLKQPLTLVMTYLLPLQNLGDDRYQLMPPAHWTRHYLLVDPDAHRNNPFKLRYPFVLSVSSALKLPASLSAVQMPTGQTENSMFGEFDIRWSEREPGLHQAAEIREVNGLFPAEAYQQYLGYARNAYGVMRRPIQFTDQSEN